MRRLWTHREIDAPLEVVWSLLTDVDRWHEWGPSVRRAVLHGERFEHGATGTVTTAVGVDVGFEITEFGPGEHWAWRVAGLPATQHSVESLGTDRCRAGFGVPWPAAPYLAVCELALRRIERLAEVGLPSAAQEVSR